MTMFQIAENERDMSNSEVVIGSATASSRPNWIFMDIPFHW
jgi:hypothetical protein